MALTSSLAGRNLGMILLGLWLILTGLLPLLSYQSFIHGDYRLRGARYCCRHINLAPSLGHRLRPPVSGISPCRTAKPDSSNETGLRLLGSEGS